jgi:hypothetical protein
LPAISIHHRENGLGGGARMDALEKLVYRDPSNTIREETHE